MNKALQLDILLNTLIKKLLRVCWSEIDGKMLLAQYWTSRIGSHFIVNENWSRSIELIPLPVNYTAYFVALKRIFLIDGRCY